MKKLLSLLFVLGLTLSACGTAQTQSAPSAQTSAPSIVPTATQTPISPTSTVTPLPTIPTFTPTFDVSTILTVIPAEKAECPDETIQKEFNPNNLNSQVNDLNQQFISYTLDYLNSGGTTSSIRLSYPSRDDYFRIEDITGDGISEIIFAFGIWIDIFGCTNGKYELSTISTFDTAQGSEIIDMVDINSDGVKEVIAYFDGCFGSRCPSVEVIGWNGSKFQSLIEDHHSLVEGCSYMNIAPFQVEIKDIDNSGTSEIVLQNTGKPFPDDLAFPYRKETRICAWNGKGVALQSKYFDEPHYLFQAVEDADMAVRFGDFQRAMTFYQRTIQDKNLEWFTPEKRIHDFWVYHSNYFGGLQEPTPTASPSLQPDPTEYPRLAAYAYYRIMLLHLVQGQEAEAASTYQTLQETFGDDPYASPHVEMASAFWESYQSTQKMYDGCAAAIQYAVEHPEILTPLGSDYHGWQSHIYAPADVCPFR